MIFDTMTPWTTIIEERAAGNFQIINNYNLNDSRTANVIYSDPITKTPDSHGLNFGTAQFSGTAYKDNICLK